MGISTGAKVTQRGEGDELIGLIHRQVATLVAPRVFEPRAFQVPRSGLGPERWGRRNTDTASRKGCQSAHNH